VEANWEDGAVRRDKFNRIFADPAKIHRVRHNGPRYQVDAIHLAEPSPQRTPVRARGSERRPDPANPHSSAASREGAETPRDGLHICDWRSEARGGRSWRVRHLLAPTGYADRVSYRRYEPNGVRRFP